MSALGTYYDIEYVDGTTETLRGDSFVGDGVLVIREVGYRKPSIHIPLMQIKRWTSRSA